MQVAGRELPAGAGVLAPTSMVHRDRRGFADPDRFEPERRLGAEQPA